MGMQQNGMAMPQGPMSPGMSAVGNMPPPQVRPYFAVAFTPSSFLTGEGASLGKRGSNRGADTGLFGELGHNLKALASSRRTAR